MESTQLNAIPNHHNIFLDLVISNTNCLVSKSEDPVLTEDLHHPALLITYSAKTSKLERNNCKTHVNNSYVFWNFRKANIPLLYNTLEKVDWSTLKNFNDVDEACSHFYNILHSLFYD